MTSKSSTTSNNTSTHTSSIRECAKTVPLLKYIVRRSREIKKVALLGPLWPIMRRTLMKAQGMSLRKFAATVLLKGEVVFDIGANNGETALLMASCVGSSGHVCAFEPNPTLFARLSQCATSTFYRNLHAIPFALSDTIGTLTLLIDLRDGAGASTIVAQSAERETAWHGASYKPTLVSATTLDAFCDKYDRVPTFIKIDVEGAEEMVVRGGRKVIANHKTLIWFELWAGLDNGVQINQNLSHFKQLSEAGYAFFVASIFKVSNRWVPECDPANPAKLMPLDPEILEQLPVIGCDILAATPSQMERLHKCGLVSRRDAKSHILGLSY